MNLEFGGENTVTGFERYRRKKLLSQVQLAKVLGVTAAAVSSWETRIRIYSKIDFSEIKIYFF